MWAIHTLKNYYFKQDNFPTCLLQFSPVWPKPILAAQSAKWKPTLDRMLSLRTTITLGQFGRAILPKIHIFGMKEKNQSTWRKPTYTWGEHANPPPPPQTVTPAGNRFFSYQHYNETTLNEMKLFEDLLHSNFRQQNYIIDIKLAKIYPIIFLKRKKTVT